MWIAVHHDKKEAITLFSKEIAAAATGGGKCIKYSLRTTIV